MSKRWTFSDDEVETLRDCLQHVEFEVGERLGRTLYELDVVALRMLQRKVSRLRARLFSRPVIVEKKTA